MAADFGTAKKKTEDAGRGDDDDDDDDDVDDDEDGDGDHHGSTDKEPEAGVTKEERHDEDRRGRHIPHHSPLTKTPPAAQRPCHSNHTHTHTHTHTHSDGHSKPPENSVKLGKASTNHTPIPVR